MVRRTREARRSDAELLNVAAKLFRDRGFAATGLRDIAREAGMLPGSLHYRYPTKDSLLVALMERSVDRALTAVTLATIGVGDPMRALRAGVVAHLEVMLSGDDAIDVLLYDWRVVRGDSRAAIVRIRDRYEAFWDGLLYRVLGSGIVRPDVDPRTLRLIAFGAINWVATWYRDGGKLGPTEIADAVIDMFARGVLTDDARRAFATPAIARAR